MASAYLSGERIDWEAYYRPYVKALRKVPLPTYRFETQRYWMETQASSSSLSYELRYVEERRFSMGASVLPIALLASEWDYEAIKSRLPLESTYYQFSASLEGLSDWLLAQAGREVVWLIDAPAEVTESLSFYEGLFQGLQALSAARVEVTLVTRLGQSVLGDEAINPYAASLVGLVCKGLA